MYSGRSRNRVHSAMASLTEGDAVGDVKPQFREIRPRLDVVGMQADAAHPALLTGEIIPSENGGSPRLVLVPSFGGFSRFLVPSVFGMSHAAPELRRSLPRWIIGPAANAIQPSGAQCGIGHLPFGLLAATLAPFWCSGICVHGCDGPNASGSCCRTHSQRLPQILFPRRGVMSTTARAIRRRLSDAYAVIVVSLTNFKDHPALGARHRNTTSIRFVLTRTRTGLPSSVFQPRRVNQKCVLADLTYSFNLRHLSMLLRSSNMGQVYQIAGAD